jgi:Transposase DDE domain
MCQHDSVNIRKISRNRAEQAAYYRFLENERVTITELVGSLADSCQEQVSGLHVLAISDTSEINLQSHIGRLKPEGLGVVGNNRDLGFFIHPTLVLNAETGFPLGLSEVQVWTRALNRPNKHDRDYAKLPIEQKESFKWLRSAAATEHYMEAGSAVMTTHIGDRESDLYEEWARVPDARNQVLVRVKQDRRLWGQDQSLYQYLGAQPVQGTYTVRVLADLRIPRAARDAELTVRFAPVSIRRPDQVSRDYPSSVDLYAVEVTEIHPPNGEPPVHWRLLTTHRVDTLEQALQIVQWYRWRWYIEQLFATLKQVGLQLEDTQLESGPAMQRLTILALSVAVRILQMVVGRENIEVSAHTVFSQQEQQCIEQLGPTLEGNTLKQQNPYPKHSLPWATWVIARLGGWSGYQSQRPPGMPTLVNGLRRFEAIFLGWQLTRAPCIDTGAGQGENRGSEATRPAPR